MTAQPKVGVGVFIVKDKKLLFGYRESAHGRGTWSPPGGHIEFGESPEACAIRETREETGLIISRADLFAVTNDFFEEKGKHYITLLMVAEPVGGSLHLTEPDKMTDFKWCEPHETPSPLFLSIEHIVAARPTLMHELATYFSSPKERPGLILS